MVVKYDAIASARLNYLVLGCSKKTLVRSAATMVAYAGLPCFQVLKGLSSSPPTCACRNPEQAQPFARLSVARRTAPADLTGNGRSATKSLQIEFLISDIGRC